MQLSAEELKQPVSEDSPSGEDLEYDPVFQEMEVMMETTAEQEFGDTIIPGSGPDWKGVAAQVEDLNKRTRDLRVLTCGALADLSLKGLKVFSESLESLNTCIETFWDSIHPQLDVEDDNDATMRLNALQILNDYEMVSFGLERAPLLEVRGLGSFSLRDIEIAEGKKTPVGDETAHDIGLIQGAFGDAEADVISVLGEGVRGSISQLKRASTLWDKLATNAPSLEFGEILKVLEEIRQAVEKYAPQAAAELEDGAEGEGADEAQAEGEAGTARGVSLSGSINNRTDVVKAIDKICDYYTTHEPSSPIPLLLRRAQRLVAKSFVEILEDMAPDGVAQAKVVSGESD
jgi:type VI secretion system protein ImpA